MMLIRAIKLGATAVQKISRAVAGNIDAGGMGSAAAQVLYGALGIIARPPTPKGDLDASPAAEGFAFEWAGGLVPFAWLDRRLSRLYPNPKEGSVALVGYGGAFDSNEATLDDDGNPVSSIRTTYVPYAFVNGVATKAHVITIDGTAGNESIAIVHGDGMAVTMKAGGKNSLVLKNKAGDAYVEVNDDGNVINGNTVINGGATIGSPVGALPVAIAAKLALYITQLETDIAAAITAVGVGPAASGIVGAAAFTAVAPARAALVGAIPATKLSGL